MCIRDSYKDPAATLDDLREAVTTLEDAGRIARRVFGGEHPFTEGMEGDLRIARAVLSAREGDVEPLREAVAAVAIARASTRFQGAGLREARGA